MSKKNQKENDKKKELIFLAPFFYHLNASFTRS